jgi:hypothetical protein
VYDAIQLGPFTLQYFLIVILFAFLVTYYLIESLIKSSLARQFILKHYWTAALLIVVTYKFSIVLIRPDLLLTFSWLYVSGGQDGIYLGLSISMIYLCWIGKKENISLKIFIHSIMIMVFSYLVVFQLIKIIVLSFV